MTQPNIVFLLTDQWRLQALGYAGNEQVQTPHIDKLSRESINFQHAISGYSVCCPWRASFLTGQYPLTHGVFVNDVPVGSNPVGLGDAFKAQGYNTALIGKWHIDGQGRSAYIPPERRLGFDYFKALECTHDYNNSAYYDNNDDTKHYWEGYDVFAQTADAQQYLHAQSSDNPFLLVLSWGPPHNPYETAPQEFRNLYERDGIQLRDNVPPELAKKAQEWLAGYYAHCTAIDKSVGDIVQTLDELNLEDDTILIFASDHGDMLGSHGIERKQKPYEESIRVPFLVRHPARYGRDARTIDTFLNAHDIMPTLLGLCDLPIPDTVEGRDVSATLDGNGDIGEAVLLACFHPFGEWARNNGGREYRGVRTTRYTYCRTLDAPWLLYDNETDPYQQNNLINEAEHAVLQLELEALLQKKLEAIGDEFLDGLTYVNQWGYPLDETGTVPFTW